MCEMHRQCRVSGNISALMIHMSEEAHNAIMAFPEFITECRGDIAVKVENNHCVFAVHSPVY